MKQEQKFLNFVPPYPVIFLLLQSTNSPQSVLAPELPHPKHKFNTVLSLPQGFLMFCHLDFIMCIYEGFFILPSVVFPGLILGEDSCPSLIVTLAATGKALNL